MKSCSVSIHVKIENVRSEIDLPIRGNAQPLQVHDYSISHLDKEFFPKICSFADEANYISYIVLFNTSQLIKYEHP